ncbi:KEOPS complex subunit Pcc1 [uncultured Methanobrevibacter sp.]|uniref:KEOPS complex subunit Pcc1 n=1 Tax=uncultured Methanobrevibacter sp. TaxID=253161 RepID=UPI0025F80DDB|nr:KEOPS complex subunit Pcc1 [uncultured Methanobrevibacter sp.]
MKIESTLKIKYIKKESAEISFETLNVDNEGFVKSQLNENIIDFEINSNSLGTFLNTTDDLIANEILFEEIIQSSKN